MNMDLKMKDRIIKQVFREVGYLWEKRGIEKIKEDEYGQQTLYTYME
jgi:hypothetical protein